MHTHRTPDPCPSGGEMDYHVRLYPSPSYDVNFGYFVVGETHEDYNDYPDCKADPNKAFGWEEEAENYITNKYFSSKSPTSYYANTQQCFCWQGNNWNDSDAYATWIHL
jgi:7-cyano-7-deazaguanine synthase in queuosine biosynthesis